MALYRRSAPYRGAGGSDINATISGERAATRPPRVGGAVEGQQRKPTHGGGARTARMFGCGILSATQASSNAVASAWRASCANQNGTRTHKRARLNQAGRMRAARHMLCAHRAHRSAARKAGNGRRIERSGCVRNIFAKRIAHLRIKRSYCARCAPLCRARVHTRQGGANINGIKQTRYRRVDAWRGVTRRAAMPRKRTLSASRRKYRRRAVRGA